MAPQMAAQHRELQRLLRASGTEVLTLESLLESAIDAARSRGVFAVWLRALYPALSARPDAVTARTLLGLDPVVRYQRLPDRTYRHVADGSRSLMFSRDATVMTPRGLLIAHLSNTGRAEEPALSRLLADFAPAFREYPVVFDAAQEGLFVEGGDIQVVDERTLIVGVGNRTDPRVSRRCSRGASTWTSLRWRCGGLRSSRAGPRSTDSVPCCCTWTRCSPTSATVSRWRCRGFSRLGTPARTRSPPSSRAWARARNLPTPTSRPRSATCRTSGAFVVYRAGSGDEDVSVKDLKLVDYVRRQGYDVVHVGGPPPSAPGLRVPGRGRSSRTRAAGRQRRRHRAAAGHRLRRRHAHTRGAARRGRAVSTFDARELWPWNGGPHCLTLPLERG